jgi:seryl-tRNA synthetase
MSTQDPSTGPETDPIEEAAASLSAAIGRVSTRLNSLKRRLDAASDEMSAAHGNDEDRARLADALDASRAREAELNEAVEVAAQAVDAALATLARSGADTAEDEAP